MTAIGFIGGEQTGTLAPRAADAGHEVIPCTSRRPEISLAYLVVSAPERRSTRSDLEGLRK
jgi:hypothetical protein